MQLNITARDRVLARYGNQLAALGEGQARTAMSRALNHEGDKGGTQVKRTLDETNFAWFACMQRRKKRLGCASSGTLSSGYGICTRAEGCRAQHRCTFDADRQTCCGRRFILKIG
jgi:hypothetical protein